MVGAVDDEATTREINVFHCRTMHDVDRSLRVPLGRMQLDVVSFTPQILFAQRRTRVGTIGIGREDGDGQLVVVPGEMIRPRSPRRVRCR